MIDITLVTYRKSFKCNLSLTRRSNEQKWNIVRDESIQKEDLSSCFISMDDQIDHLVKSKTPTEIHR